MSAVMLIDMRINPEVYDFDKEELDYLSFKQRVLNMLLAIRVTTVSSPT